MFFLTEPSDEALHALLRARADAGFTYAGAGATRDDLRAAPPGFHLDRYGCELGRGQTTFERAKAAVGRLANYPPTFTRVVREPGELAPGSLFMTVARHLGFASAHPCRVIYVVDEPARYGFGFGTLPGHAESGEERFLVSIERDVVRYDVQAFSRPVGLLPRLGTPITRGYQVRFQRETLETMRGHARG